MFTKNYVTYRYNRFFNLYSGSKDGIESMGYLKGVTGADMTMFEGNARGDIGTALFTPACQAELRKEGVWFGTGTTPATLNDYKLGAPITSGLTFLTKSVSTVCEGNGVWSVVGIYGLQNTTSSSITISEIGVFSFVKYEATYGEVCLMERTVLTEPIVIEPGKAKNITYKLTFHQ